jgi:UDP-N-acetyl-2-amino-2-deoxyglucuronate dehydrogenase
MPHPRDLGDASAALSSGAVASAGSSNGLSGYRVAWPALGHSVLESFRLDPVPAAHVTVELVASIISTGTERARYLGLPSAGVSFPHHPGYAASGVVTGIGPSVDSIAVNDRVAVLGVAHQSLAMLPSSGVYRVPSTVALEDAAILQLGIIAAHGVRRAALAEDEPYAVFGAGIIGALAQRIARTRAAGPCTVVAATHAKATTALAGGAERFLSVERDLPLIEQLSLPVIIDATGDPAALVAAIKAVAPQGRVILLGSPRGVADAGLPIDLIVRKQLRVIGAHVNGLGRRGQNGGPGASLTIDATATEAALVLDALASGQLKVADLFDRSTIMNPREAALIYRRLATDRSIVGARFDWAGFSRNGHNGASSEPWHRARPQRASSPVDLDQPFAGARGLVGFGLIGCGEIAVANAAALAEAPNTSIVACHDVDRPLAEELASQYEASVASSVTALLERKDVDAVVLSLPNHLHAQIAIQAIRAGKHVVVEKPLAHDLEAAISLVAAAEGAKVLLSVCFPERYKAHNLLARAHILAGVMGEPSGVEVRWYADKPPSYMYGGFTGRSPSTWRKHRSQAGGGVLLMNLSHDVDLVRHLTGLTAERVMALTTNTDKVGEVEDSVTISVQYTNGAIGSLVGSSATRGLRHESLRLWGADGRIDVKPQLEIFTLRALDDLPTAEPVTLQEHPRLPTRAIYFSRFANAVVEEQAPDITGADGLAVQGFIEAAYRSSVSGCAVRPDDLLKELRRLRKRPFRSFT